MRLEELGSSISDNQFILHILNNMTDDNDLQLAMMEKRVTDKSNPLTIDKIRDNLNQRFKRLNENDNDQEVACFGGQFKGKCRNCGTIGHKAKDCKLNTNQMTVRTREITTIFRKIGVTALIALIVNVQVTLKAIVSN
jgi:purine-nucleoside phosphorylase